MDISPNAYVPLAIIGAALVAGTVTFLSTLLSKDQKTSEFRQNWIDALRTDISDLLGSVESFVGYLNYFHKEHGLEDAKRYFEKQPEAVSNSAVLYRRIILRLNPKEHKELRLKLDTLLTLFSGQLQYSQTKEVGRLLQELVDESQRILKKEWRRVKRGEVAFWVTKYLSLTITVVALVSVALIANGKLSVQWVNHPSSFP